MKGETWPTRKSFHVSRLTFYLRSQVTGHRSRLVQPHPRKRIPPTPRLRRGAVRGRRRLGGGAGRRVVGGQAPCPGVRRHPRERHPVDPAPAPLLGGVGRIVLGNQVPPGRVPADDAIAIAAAVLPERVADDVAGAVVIDERADQHRGRAHRRRGERRG